jgi:hypothetical protein
MLEVSERVLCFAGGGEGLRAFVDLLAWYKAVKEQIKDMLILPTKDYVQDISDRE